MRIPCNMISKRVKKVNNKPFRATRGYWVESLTDGIGSTKAFNTCTKLANREPHYASKKYKYTDSNRKRK